ncbi:predicted Zn peptidase (plasmid) [Geminocystis sp. NIES-3708]|uniref:ImmA/IrrE family metallo-endopeptidase n=1 Tax=Geminocystis sp. NIES-3708 TaxID=1615909 RepID=UPI0005FC8DDD|nr:ImmA/IrrE family metallo-endopeptidase [Geminocystis sp. NIES-3708]BAQ63220.1 predicted Zn peptidase [Geminocystis sp. NIES-3708]
MTNTLTMDALYKKLDEFGIKKGYVRKNGLPSWWDEELNNKPVAVLECSGYIADRFGLDLKSLLSEDEVVKFRGITETKFKQRLNNKKSEIAHGLANRFAEMIAYGYESNFTGIPDNVDEIRAEILQTHSTINLNSLLDYCWLHGIAVAHFNEFPERATKFYGMIQLHNNKPVIVLAINYKESPKLAFILAHELGHLALKHITEGELFDEKIEFNNDGNNEEQEANQFAVKLLLGDCDNCFEDKKFHNQDHLIKKVKEIVSINPTIDMGSIIFNNAWHNNNNWGFANIAFQKLYPDDNGQKLINEYLANKLDWDKFDDDNYEYLEQVLGV